MQASARETRTALTSAGMGTASLRMARISGFFAAAILRLTHWSWRKDLAEAERIDRLLDDGKRVAVVFWHGKYAPLFPLLAGRKACIFTTPSFRGAILAEISRRFGYECIILPAKGGRAARAVMIEALRSHNATAIAVDGPLGPYHRVKRGVLDISAELGFTLLPVSASASRRRVIEERWDRREIPRLFTRIVLAVGDPIGVPTPLAVGDIPLLRQRLHDVLEALGRRADEMASDPSPSKADLFIPPRERHEGQPP